MGSAGLSFRSAMQCNAMRMMLHAGSRFMIVRDVVFVLGNPRRPRVWVGFVEKGSMAKGLPLMINNYDGTFHWVLTLESGSYIALCFYTETFFYCPASITRSGRSSPNLIQ
ncbi:hypothetical protein L228DRAFT_84319 [Xylona heveae TC161]|uniref:Uncharacterized protein n=1 Tax=Xylona heveae (strain CBS 132557 / TC161) TaxID=1328760 RepID=A0A165J6T5_XYLHT|nr:hypothetical protein L228DRAFT_84319 [Xylona heveae TC161]KZF25814.1 hypothetical protein L228DRAFT_84319 [Xylona heveae TC161]